MVRELVLRTAGPSSCRCSWATTRTPSRAWIFSYDVVGGPCEEDGSIHGPWSMFARGGAEELDDGTPRTPRWLCSGAVRAADDDIRDGLVPT